MKNLSRLAGLIGVLALAGCGPAGSGTVVPGGSGPSVPSPAARPEPAVSLPDGWRWESYRTVEVGVPDDWGYGTTGSPWCIRKADEKPYAGRPGPVPAVACAAQVPPGGADPGTLARTGGTFVWFGASADPPGAPGSEGDRVTRVVGGTFVAVQAPRTLRDQILATIHRVAADQNGCPVSHPIVDDPAWRPRPVSEVGVSPVTSVSACRYTREQNPPLGLMSSVRLTGTKAAAALRTVREAPVGGGPDRPSNCTKDSAYGDEVIVLQVHRQASTSQIVLRYGGCDHHGFDDGSTVRTLTRASVAPFVTGPNTINEWSGELNGVLLPHT